MCFWVLPTPTRSTAAPASIPSTTCITASGITANLADPSQNTGNAAGDTYTNITDLIGTNYDDTLIGDGNVNALEGGAGADTLIGGGGAIDYASYTHASTGVTANLADPDA